MLIRQAAGGEVARRERGLLLVVVRKSKSGGRFTLAGQNFK